VILFIFFSYAVQTNIDFFKSLIGEGFYGMFVYVFVTIIAVVFAPVSTMPLMPIASNLWGVISAAILSIIGWTIGAFIAFFIARKYGVKIVKKIIPIKKIDKYEKFIPQKNIFWSIVFLRLILPVDILSYALGLFGRIKTKTYMLATIIGITPFAFLWAYFGEIPYQYQIVVLIIVMIILFLGYMINQRKKGS